MDTTTDTTTTITKRPKVAEIFGAVEKRFDEHLPTPSSEPPLPLPPSAQKKINAAARNALLDARIASLDERMDGKKGKKKR